MHGTQVLHRTLAVERGDGGIENLGLHAIFRKLQFLELAELRALPERRHEFGAVSLRGKNLGGLQQHHAPERH